MAKDTERIKYYSVLSLPYFSSSRPAPWPTRFPEPHGGVCGTEVPHTVADDWVRDQMSITRHFQVSKDKMGCIQGC